ncbi:carbonic anhydrase 9-like isoform X1 [Neodiprion virginianus]|uniref:carbonic anhydrase 9-like isoform X1 n=1 Tax=Neodiprion virginianus TaxID=2961670 RepID=UPI001EE75F84|nr:carbonic anhydrase 9-like isoform X1 [Neodiprion virginianus]XP_046617618.1 carbonic anhydrase 9-like isoform X1 [Neodiprion virginianus]
MIKLFGVFLAISLNTPSFLAAHVLSKRENFPRLPDSPELIDDPYSEAILWAEENDRAGDVLDHDQGNADHSNSWTLAYLTTILKNPEDYQDPETQQDDGLLETDQNQYPHEESEDQRDDEIRLVPAAKQTTHEVQETQYKEQRGKQENIGTHGNSEKKREGEFKDHGNKVYLFSSQGPQTRGNMGLFQREFSRLVPFGLQDPPSTRQDKPDVSTTNGNPSPTEAQQPAGDTGHFSYSHPEEWSRDSPECSGKFQSPVNLESNKLVALDVPPSLIWTGYWNLPQNLTITDNGHSVELSGSWEKAMTPFISGGPLTGDYAFSQLHFHWGPRDSVGSEHTIDNKSFPMEMHMVHYKRDYQTFAEALKHDDGLAVVAFLFEMSDMPNLGINLLENSFCKLHKKLNVRIPVIPYPLAMLHHTFQDDYVFYIGSLTTPPCREIVTWLVSSSPLTISEKQLDSFRKISNKWPEKENYRPRQPLNGRNLYYATH